VIVRSPQQAVLEFWRACEMFSPQHVPKEDLGRRAPVEEWVAGRPLPWEATHRPEFARSTMEQGRSGSKPAKTVHYEWRHTVYLVVYPLEALYAALERVFPPDDESFDPRPSGESALASFVVDHDGYLVPDSALLSACGWATGVVGRNGGRVDRLDGLDEAQQKWLEGVDKLVAEHTGDPTAPAPLDAEVVHGLAVWTVSFTRFPKLARAGAVRVQSQRIRSDRAQDLKADFLNSFFLDDLSVVAAAAARPSSVGGAQGRAVLGRALSRYLSEGVDVALDRRIDVQHDLDQVHAAVEPRQLPDGRWPSDARHPLALSQQLAVNLVGQGAGEGLFAVNGPPGTGKTTMLRDLFAARVVDRAHRLAALARPEHGFGGALPVWRSDDNPRVVHQLIPALTGFEMVVASSNNAAVTNVSDEIPSLEAIAASYRGRVDYFTEVATALLQPARAEEDAPDGDPGGEEDEPVDTPSAPLGPEAVGARQAWALTAARLGRKSNRSAFMTRFWIGDKGIDRYEAMQPLLHRRRFEPPSAPGWDEARDAFDRAVAREHAAVGFRDLVLGALGRLSVSGTFLTESEARWTREAEREYAARTELERLVADISQTRRDLRHLADLHVGRRPRRPGWLRNLVTLGSARREWAEADHLDPAEADRQRTLSIRLETLQRAESVTEDDWRQASRVLEELRAAIEHHREEVRTATRVLDDAPTSWGDALPSPAWWSSDVERREKTGPWLDEEMNDLRVQVLLAALDLHTAFVVGNASTFETSLRAAMDVLTGTAPAEVAPATRLAAWQVLFLVVPLVSTTFASVGRMLRELPPEGLGWLLVDEAGQSAPQLAVGAMWRAQNVVVVGDPRQLQPVVTLPYKLEGALAKAYGVDAKWRPLTTSVQGLADEVNLWGTQLTASADEPPLWIGAPLRVHRRCDQPMLDICNQIAYPVGPSPDADPAAATGLMIDGVPPRDPLPLPCSQWYHQPVTSSQGHFVPAELVLLQELLDQVLAAGVPLREIICISPFRDTADRLSGLSDTYGDGFRGGTIHTAQGQEADVVFLVLGGDPAKPGAKVWASKRPNLVNVAVSRARRRLYVIGDQVAWSSYPYFDVMSSRLDDWKRDHRGGL
jgi:hypothetical protein